jgi:hypothetical protein
VQRAIKVLWLYMGGRSRQATRRVGPALFPAHHRPVLWRSVHDSVTPSCRQSNFQTFNLPPPHHHFPSPHNIYSLTGQLCPLTTDLTTRTTLQTPQWPTSSPRLRTSILVYHCILTTTHRTWTNSSPTRSHWRYFRQQQHEHFSNGRRTLRLPGSRARPPR